MVVREELLEKFGNYLKLVLGILVGVGIIMVYSSSYMYSKEQYGSSLHFLWRQIFFVIVSAAGAFIVSKTKYKFWYKFSFHLNILVSLAIALTYIPGLGVVAKGANRWISLGGFSLQPGEFAKYTVLLLSIFIFENLEKMDHKTMAKYLANLALPLVLLLGQPDFGTFFICCMVIFFSCFMSRFPRKWFYSLTVVGFLSGVAILLSQPYRVRRLTAFLDPWKNAQGSGFQVIQSWIGFANGGFFGKGAGNSLEKLFFLPEAHNDFIFSVIGEEFGLIGVIFMVGLFLSFIYLGFRLAMLMKDRVAMMMTALVTFVIGLQAVLNMGVVLGLLPTKGLNLPFISYGGSSLLASLFAVGLIFSCLNRQSEVIISSSTGSSGSSGPFFSHSNETSPFKNGTNRG
ncbi:putative lipid II flippase FtsW [Bacteriovorax sp. DB6_IX]|uniref:putative lipid II flippase FtsW n=1 Tax=Bacteriovorax sp. DB6_IX TaxID=1353530 RepID=UPI00038A0618|nr:putative lipid II flippase FtsW [Bacteriovorax sp. DB6_IX]EQC50637.1 cell division protein FtsW [Bacteriovorax sp. DB6_IX]